MIKFSNCIILLWILAFNSCNIKNNDCNSSNSILLDNLVFSTKAISEQSKYQFHALKMTLNEENLNPQSAYLFEIAEMNYSRSNKIRETIANLREKYPIPQNDIEAICMIR